MATYFIMFTFWVFFGAVFVTTAIIVLGEEHRQYPRQRAPHDDARDRSAAPGSDRRATRHEAPGSHPRSA